MKGSLQNKCDLFADNYKVLKANFAWGYTINNRLGALLYSMENKEVDPQAIRDCKDLIKKNTGIFSQFKDVTNFMVSTTLSLQAEPERILQNTLRVYDEMKQEGFYGSPYLVLAAVSIATQVEENEYLQTIRKAKEFYHAMKEEHPFLTSRDDYGYATLLSISGISIPEAVKEMEQCYHLMKEEFFSPNSVQALSQVLTFGEGNAETKCKRVIEQHRALKARGYNFGAGSEMPFLGVLALLKEDSNTMADEIEELHEYLKTKPGFGSLSIAKKERLMYAIALVCDDYMEETRKNTLETALTRNVTGVILAQQMATITAAAAATSAAAASSN